MDDVLQRAIDALSIEDVSIQSVRAKLADGYDPKYEADTDNLLIELKHVVKAFEVAEASDGPQIFRVFVELGVRWTRPSESPGSGENVDETADAKTQVAFVEAVMVAEYSMDQSPGEDALEQFAFQNASFHIWPYWREYAHSQCRRMNLPRFVLPTRQFL